MVVITLLPLCTPCVVPPPVYSPPPRVCAVCKMNVHHRCMPLVAHTCGMNFTEPYGRMHLKLTSEPTDKAGTFCVTVSGECPECGLHVRGGVRERRMHERKHQGVTH